VELSVRDLHVTYRTRSGGVPAVRGVSFDLAWGQSIGIAGESGCGKSTMGAALLRLLPKDALVSGEVILDGENVYSMTFGRLRAVRWTELAIVFQGALHSLNPVRRVGWQIAEAIELHDRGLGRKAVKARVGELLEQVGLPGRRADDYPHQMSGGQRQRVLIAMALACRPHLLIADEPTTALDVMVQAQVLELLQRLRVDHDLAMIFITHDLSLLTYVCERIAVMYAGRIVEEGPSDEVFEHPRHPYTAALSAAFPTIGDHASRMAPSGLPGDPPDPADLPAGCSFAPRCPEVEARCHEIAIELRAAGPGRRAACIHVDAPATGQPAARQADPR
jgi:peptide/nickel transport system ATP-binding protein